MGADPEWNTCSHLCRQTDAKAAIRPQGVTSVISAFLRSWNWKGNGNRDMLDIPPVLLGQSECLNCGSERLTFLSSFFFVLLVRPPTMRSATHQSWDTGSTSRQVQHDSPARCTLAASTTPSISFPVGLFHSFELGTETPNRSTTSIRRYREEREMMPRKTYLPIPLTSNTQSVFIRTVSRLSFPGRLYSKRVFDLMSILNASFSSIPPS